MLWIEPPYYGRVFDLVRWEGFGSGARVSELMLLIPTFLCGISVACKKDRLLYLTVSMSLVAVFLNLFLEKRIFFIMAFLVLPILFLLFNVCHYCPVV